MCVCGCAVEGKEKTWESIRADSRFGAGVGRQLFEQLAVSLVPHQGVLSNQLGARRRTINEHGRSVMSEQVELLP